MKIRKNSKQYKQAIAQASGVKVFNLDNDFIGGDCANPDLSDGVLSLIGRVYVFHVHSNRYYKWVA